MPFTTTWQDIIDQWYDGVPSLGIKPLMKWTFDELCTPARAAEIRKRKDIVTEYVLLGKQEFIQKYIEPNPAYCHSDVESLWNLIHPPQTSRPKKNKRCKTSK
jgi:hypothetical protein